MFEYSVQDCEKLAHASGNGDLLGLPCAAKSHVEGSNDGIMLCGRQRSHPSAEGQHRSYRSSPSPNGAFASKVTTIAVEGSNAYQCGDLLSVQGAEFWKLSQKGSGEDRPYPWHAPQQSVFLSPERAFSNAVIQVPIGVGQLLFQPGDMSLDTLHDGLASCEKAVPLGSEHFDQLTSPSQDGSQLLSGGIGQRTRHRANCSSKVSQHPGIQGIGLGQLPRRLSKISHLARVHHCHRYTSHSEGGCDRQFNTSSGFQDHKGGGDNS